MRSSTSSSEPAPELGGDLGFVARPMPRGRWSVALAVAVVLALAVVGAWEAKVRADGYDPSRNDTADQWSRIRAQVGEGPARTVVIGSSRIQFDLDLEVYAEAMGEPIPLQLALVGSNPLGVLEHLAADERFTGTLILGATPALWFIPQGDPVERSRQATGRYDNWSPSQKVGTRIAAPLQDRLAFINPDDLALGMLLRNRPWPVREAAAANVPPHMPAHFGEMDEHRQIRMWEACDFGTPRAKMIQDTWLELFKPPPPPPGVTPEEFEVMMAEGAKACLDRVVAATTTLEERGVRMVWVRPPSSGVLRDIERQAMPRERTWDALVGSTGLPGIHFEDYPEMAGFECPEWSHLNAEDATAWTRALMPHLKAALEGA